MRQPVFDFNLLDHIEQIFRRAPDNRNFGTLQTQPVICMGNEHRLLPVLGANMTAGTCVGHGPRCLSWWTSFQRCHVAVCFHVEGKQGCSMLAISTVHQITANRLRDHQRQPDQLNLADALIVDRGEFKRQVVGKHARVYCGPNSRIRKANPQESTCPIQRRGWSPLAVTSHKHKRHRIGIQELLASASVRKTLIKTISADRVNHMIGLQNNLVTCAAHICCPRAGRANRTSQDRQPYQRHCPIHDRFQASKPKPVNSRSHAPAHHAHL